jgi:site-specific recombinase XerD
MSPVPAEIVPAATAVLAGPSGASSAAGMGGAEVAALRTDASLIEQFLRERCQSPHTEVAYRSSLRRLGWFCRHIGLASIRELQREQWAVYRQYLRAPPPEHIMAVSVAYGHPSWAPFRGGLSDLSAKQSEIIGKAFLAWMADPAIGALMHSPVSSIRTRTARRSATTAAVERYVPVDDWLYIEQALDQWPRKTLQQRRGQVRARWVMCLAVRTGLRASEIAAARASDVRASVRHPGKYNLHLVRKGGVQATLPLLPEVWSAYKEFLSQYELSLAHAQAAGDLPLVLPLRGEDLKPPVKNVSRTHVWQIVKEVMRAAADLAMQSGNEAAQQRLRQASTHWLRHTFASNLLDQGADLRSVRDLLDHASITTTNQYLHRPEDRLREDLERLADSQQT